MDIHNQEDPSPSELWKILMHVADPEKIKAAVEKANIRRKQLGLGEIKFIPTKFAEKGRSGSGPGRERDGWVH